MGKSAQRQFLVKVAGINGYFVSKSGGNIAAASNKTYDGGQTTPDITTGPSAVDDVTCGRHFDPMVDAAILASLRGRVGEWTTTVSVTPTDRNLIPVGPPVTYSNAVLTGITEPAMDANSGDNATYDLMFAVSSVA